MPALAVSLYNPPLDLTSGGTIGGDVTINGNLTVTGATTTVVNTVLSGTLTVNVGSSAALNVTEGASAASVLRVDTIPTNQVVVGEGDATTQLVLPDSNDAATPTLAFSDDGNNDSGFYRIQAGRIGIGLSANLAWTMSSASIWGSNANSAYIINEAASNTNPTLCYDASSSSYGIGGSVSGGYMSGIINSTEIWRTTSTGLGVGVTPETPLSLNANAGPSIQWLNSHSVTADAGISVFDDTAGTGLMVGSNLYITNGNVATRWNTGEESCGISFGRAGVLDFYTGGTGAVGSIRMKIDSSGHLTTGTAGGPSLRQAAASSSVPVFSFDNDTDTGYSRYGPNLLSLVTGGKQCVQIGNDRTTAPGHGLLAYWDDSEFTMNAGGAIASCHLFQNPTLTAGTAYTVTDAATVYIEAAPVGAGAGPVTITNPWAFWVDAGNSRFDGNVQTGTTGSWYLNTQAASATVPTLCPADDDTNTGWGADTADTLIGITGGTERLRLDANGCMGLGVTPYNYSFLRLGDFTSGGGDLHAERLLIDGTLTGANGDTQRLCNIDIMGGITTQSNSETIALVAQARFMEPSITKGTDTITEACTVYIGSAPTEGGSNYAFHVDDGASRFDSNILGGALAAVTGNLAGGFALGNGTAASAATADAVQLWAADAGGLAGHSGLHMRGEDDASNLVVVGYKEETANAETPQEAATPGTICKFTDSGDASGNGTYQLALDGTTWNQLA